MNFDGLALSATVLMRLRLSFNRILSILRSSADMSGLIVMPDNKEFLHDTARVASKLGSLELD